MVKFFRYPFFGNEKFIAIWISFMLLFCNVMIFWWLCITKNWHPVVLFLLLLVFLCLWLIAYVCLSWVCVRSVSYLGLFFHRIYLFCFLHRPVPSNLLIYYETECSMQTQVISMIQALSGTLGFPYLYTILPA